jgi:chemotaxis protein methyltransferase CheR
MVIASAKLTSVPRPLATADDPAYLKIRDLVYSSSGIYQAEEKLYLLVSSCGRRMKEVGVNNPSEYLTRLVSHADRQNELRLLLNEITIGETYMFRHPPQLEALRNIILPEVIKAKSQVGFKRLRFWSAGCSTGEEPYTLAMFLLEHARLLPGWSYEILASDLNDNSLEKARAGIYGEYALRNTTALLRSKYFKALDEKTFQVTDHLKSLIRFERINLSDDSRMLFQKGIDVVFCCNVLIYFDLASKRRVVQHFYSNLVPGGYFFMGHAESLFQIDDNFRLIHFAGTTAYRKAPAAGGIR